MRNSAVGMGLGLGLVWERESKNVLIGDGMRFDFARRRYTKGGKELNQGILFIGKGRLKKGVALGWRFLYSVGR